jgi:hypothetical protein
MRPKTQLRALPLALALAAALALAGPAAAAGRTATLSPLSQARAWVAELLPGWRLDAWTGTTTENEARQGIDPNGLGTTTAGAENEHGHTIDPNG